MFSSDLLITYYSIKKSDIMMSIRIKLSCAKIFSTILRFFFKDLRNNYIYKNILLFYKKA